MKKSSIGLIAAALIFIGYAAVSTTAVKEGQEALLTGEQVFDPATVAANFWRDHAGEYFSKNAVDLNQLMQEADGDFEKVAKKYGHYSMGDSGELSFIVRGQGTITKVKNKLRSGYLEIKPEGYDGDTKFRLQIGTVFKGSAVRDSISLINYKDYKNQIEWAQVSVALHNLVQKDVIDPANVASLEGKQVEFIGCFTVSRPSLLNITPVELKVLP